MIYGKMKALISPHFFRQITATFASCMFALSGGMTFGVTAVLLPQLKEDPDYPYDAKYNSWIASVMPLAMMLGCVISGPMSDGLGRKTSQIILLFPGALGWLISAFAPDNTVMLLGRVVAGICSGATRPVNLVYLGEISEPKFRSVSLLYPSLAVYTGVLISHTVGKYLYWRYALMTFAIPNVLCFFIIICLQESPIWLITKGKLEQGVKSFKFFRGAGESANDELKQVLDKQGENENETSIKQTLNIIFTKAFFKSIATVFLLFIAVQFSGINTITFYSEYIFKSTFEGEVDPFTMTMVTDAIRIIMASIICVLSSKIPRRITYLISCYGTSLVLAGFVTIIYLKPVGLTWLTITLLVIYIGIASALTCTSWSFVAELFPSKIRGIGSGVSSLISFSLLFLSVKVTPDLLETFGVVALYSSFSAVTLFSAVFLTFLLPDTSGKSLQDIENSLYNKDAKNDTQTRM